MANDFEQDLRKSVKGDVSFDEMTRGLYATDASNYQVMPVAVVMPRDDARSSLAATAPCRLAGLPIRIAEATVLGSVITSSRTIAADPSASKPIILGVVVALPACL